MVIIKTEVTKYTKIEPEKKRMNVPEATSPHPTGDRRWMRLALQLAQQAGANGEVPVGCVIVKDGILLAAARNRVEEASDVTAHAELLALREAQLALGNKYLLGCTLYVTLEPCPMCAGALVWSKIDRIVYGALDPKAGACGSLFNISSSPLLNHRIAVTGGILEEESERLLKDFFAAKRGMPSQPI